MFKAIFKDAAGVQLHKIEDWKFTFTAVAKNEALYDALSELLDGEGLDQVRQNWAAVDLEHGYGDDTVLRESPDVEECLLRLQ